MRYWLTIFFLIAIPARQPLVAQGRGGHDINGAVREEGNNTPIPAAMVEITVSGNQVRPPVESSLEGQFMFEGLGEGDYEVTVSKEGYETGHTPVTVTIAGSPMVVVSLRRVEPKKTAGPGEPVSVEELKVSKKARAAYEK